MERFIRTFLSMVMLGVFYVTVYPFSVFAYEVEKITLKKDMSIVYEALPGHAETISEAFSKGIFYGRIRTNILYYDWDTEDRSTGGSKMDHKTMGIGGSLIFKSASFKGLSTTLGLYTSQNPAFFREDKADVGYLKSGKGTICRNRIKNGGAFDGDFGMTTPGQAFLRYDIAESSFILGRQLYESVFSASNDTKMIPNSFDGITADIKPFYKTKLRFAYFTAQKLRDHINSHDVIAYNSWNENDDSVVNRSLTKDLVGTDNKLVIIDANTKIVENLDTTVSFLSVPDIITNTALETKYKFGAGEWEVIPGIRIMIQKDYLHTDAPVSNLKANTNGYNDPDNLDGKLYAARVDFRNGPLFFRLGYTKVADDADIIAPWRGFPTGGYTRAMAQYNWNANTACYMLRVDYDFDKAGLIQGLYVLTRYVIQDFDDMKTGVQPDSNVFNVDIYKKLGENLEMKLRFGNADGDKSAYDINGNLKTDISNKGC